MKSELEVLVQLQEVDGRLQELEESKGDLPSKVERMINEVNKTTQDLEAKRAELVATGKAKRQTEGEVSLLEEKLKKYQKQQYAVTTNKEYDAITAEIDNTRAAIDNQETEILELGIAEENLTKAIQEIEATLKGQQAELEVMQADLKQRSAENESEERELLAIRDGLVEKVNKPILTTYDRIRKAKNGRAVVAVTHGACGGCYSNIPPQRNLEIRQMNRLFLCEVCGRILVWKDDSFSTAG